MTHLTKKEEINPGEYYSASRIILNGWFPWIKSPLTFLGMLRDNPTALALYKPIVRNVGSQTRYLIQGQIVLDIIKLSEEGKLEI